MRHLVGPAAEIYTAIKDLPIVSPHGHCDPAWFSENAAFSDPSELLVIPDHYVFRMLFSQGVPLQTLGIGHEGAGADRREIFRVFAQNWGLFLGTPSQIWIEYVLQETLGVDMALSEDTSDRIYDAIADKLARPEFRPRALFDRFKIDVLATTDSALDDLAHHKGIAQSGWSGRVVPTFRPDAVLDPMDPDFVQNVAQLGAITGFDTSTYNGYLMALRQRRTYFKDQGATATDHAQEIVHTGWLADPQAVFARIMTGSDARDAQAFYGHMLIEMAQMSVEDGLVMQLHGGSRRNTNLDVMARFGRDKGADIPIQTDWVRGLDALLNRVGNDPGFNMILFTLDESTYSRELAPMAGHWPCLRIGPPWWFHDSAAGIARYFDRVVETAGYANLAGFNDDTRAFLSIPARHDVWRRGVAVHLAKQIADGYFDMPTATDLAQRLASDLAKEAYHL